MFYQQNYETYETNENTLSELIQITPTESPSKAHIDMEPKNEFEEATEPKINTPHLCLSERIVIAKNVIKPCNSSLKSVTTIVAIDCEMVVCSQDKRKLARCSIVNYDGHILFDEYIKPDEPVVDFLTHVSGITQQKIRFAP